jgi:hypothetical protein
MMQEKGGLLAGPIRMGNVFLPDLFGIKEVKRPQL